MSVTYRYATPWLVSATIIVVVIVWKRLGMVGFDWTVGLFLVFAPISYGIYLWHTLVIRVLKEHQLGHPGNWWMVADLAVVADANAVLEQLLVQLGAGDG